MGRNKDTRTRAEKFHQSYTITPKGCWEWARSCNPKGYGGMYDEGSKVGAHRVAWEIYHGPIPKNMLVRHKCDNPPCVNPEHLELGTKADNAKDSVERRRSLVGERNTFSRLTDTQVLGIRARHLAGETTADIAEQYKITGKNVRHIVTRKTWKHLA